MSAWLLKLHRWLAVLFALPLAVVIGTGLILSFEPSLVVGSIKPGSLTAERIEARLAAHDPSGKARGISFRSYDGSLTIGGGRGNPGTTVDAATGEPRAGRSMIAAVIGTSRTLHEHLLLEGTWLTIASTIAMLVLGVLGVLMGWPRFSNNLSGWHKGTAWVALPLVLLSLLSALALGFGISFASAPPSSAGAERGPQISLRDAVRALGIAHDLSGLVWLRDRRGQMLARIVEDGEFRVYSIDGSGVQLTPRNWPRLIHEGVWKGHLSAAVNVATSLALVILFVTGLWIWARRQVRRRRTTADRTLASATAS